MTQIANDTFADTNGTALTSHTSDSGHTWSATFGSAAVFTIDTPAMLVKGAVAETTVGSTAAYVISRVPDSADYTVSIDVYPGNGITWDFPGVILRSASGADTMYRAYINEGAGGSAFATVSVDKLVASSQSFLGANTPDLAFTEQHDTLRLTVGIAGSTVTVDFLNVTTAAAIATQTYSDSAISAIGQAGMMAQEQTAGPYDAITNFSLSQTGAAPPVISPFILRSTRISPRRR